MKKIFAKLTALLPRLAFRSGVLAVNSACASYFHQPETPAAMEEYRK